MPPIAISLDRTCEYNMCRNVAGVDDYICAEHRAMVRSRDVPPAAPSAPAAVTHTHAMDFASGGHLPDGTARRVEWCECGALRTLDGATHDDIAAGLTSDVSEWRHRESVRAG